MTLPSFISRAMVAFLLLETPVVAQAPSQSMQVELYDGLFRGMTPEHASAAVLKLNGVKSAKVKKQKRPQQAMCVDVSHDMSKGGDYGGQKGFPYLECDDLGLKAVILKFAEAKNAYRDPVPMCLSNANISYNHLEDLLRSRYKEVARSKIKFDDSFLRSARVLASREKLDVALGKKSIGSLDIVDPFVIFTDGKRAIVLSSIVRHWSFYKTMPNFSQAICSADEGWQAQPEIRYASMTEWLSESESSEHEAAEKDKRDADSL